MADERETGLRLQAKEPARFLLFSIKGTMYGVHVSCVNEILLLPELKLFAERTGHFIGAVNLRGDIVTVMDLELRFGRKRGRYAVHDYLLVLESGDRRWPWSSTMCTVWSKSILSNKAARVLKM